MYLFKPNFTYVEYGKCMFHKNAVSQKREPQRFRFRGSDFTFKAIGINSS